MSTLSYYIPEDTIAEIKELCNIVQVISEYVPLKKAGTNYKGVCPFHADNEPSFMVSEAKRIYHCFGCGSGGNVFTFLMKFEHLSFPEAVKKLAYKYGISLPQREPTAIQKHTRDEKEKFFKINEHATEYYRTLLHRTPEGEKARTYLTKRGITEETIVNYTLGFASHQWDGLVKFLKKRNIPLELAHTLGLIKQAKNNEWYDCFRNRIIFPIISYNERIIGFGGRALDEESAKYINSSDSLIYKKSNSLYGLNTTLSGIRKEGYVIVVEGYFDLLSLHQHGIKNAVATLGTALTEGQVKLLKRFTPAMIIAFDTDDAGINATLKTLPLFLDHGVSPKVIELPLGDDPDSFIQREKGEGFREKIGKAIPLMELCITTFLTQHDSSTIDGKLTVVREVAPLLSKMGDTTERNLYIERLSQQIKVSEQVIRSELSREKQHRTKSLEHYLSTPDQHRAEELLLQIMMLSPEVIPAVKQAHLTDEIKEPRLKQLFSLVIECFDRDQTIQPERLLDDLEEETLKNTITQLVIKGESIVTHNIPKMLTNTIHKLKEMGIKREIQLLNIKIKDAQQEKDENAMKQCLHHKQELLEKRKRCTSDQFPTPIH